METPKSMRSFVEHVDKIDLLVPTWYGVDAQGLVQGEPNPYVLQLASQKKLPVMPILSMTQGRDGFHRLLLDVEARSARSMPCCAGKTAPVHRLSVRFREHRMD